jgi:hypothetical protein
MSLTEISEVDGGHIATPEACIARMAALSGEGFQVERVPNALVAGGLPPEMAAPMYPAELKDDAPIASGIYCAGKISNDLAAQMPAAAPNLSQAFGTNAGAPKPFDITLTTSHDVLKP